MDIRGGMNATRFPNSKLLSGKVAITITNVLAAHEESTEERYLFEKFIHFSSFVIVFSLRDILQN